MMKKFKLLSLSLLAAFSLSVSVNISSIQAAESLTPEVSVTSDTLWYSKEVPYTTTQSMWVTVTQNGKTYSGYLYNRGNAVGKPGYSFFSGKLKTGPYAPLSNADQK